MSELVGLSFDGAASPEISFEEHPDAAPDHRSGWGIAWYPVGELAAAVVRDPSSGLSARLAEVLSDWTTLRTTLVISHLRGAAKRANHRDTHPFARSFGGRSWAIAHNGDLVGDLDAVLPLVDGPLLRPIGSTDTEHLFCWLLGLAAQGGHDSIAELGHEPFTSLLVEANDLGTLNLLMADGLDLVAYQDRSLFQQLYWTRRRPPHASVALTGLGIRLELSDPEDDTRTSVIVSSVPLDGDDGWVPLAPGQMLVARRGSVVFDSHAAGSATEAVPVPRRSTAPRSLHRVLEVVHRTTYRYGTPVERASSRFRLTPVVDAGQTVLEHEVEIDAAGLRFEFDDVFGNRVTGFETTEPYGALTVVARSLVDVVTALDRPEQQPVRHDLPLVWMPWQDQMMLPYLLPAELPESQLRELLGFAMSFVDRNRADLLATLDDLTLSIHQDFTYKPGYTQLETTPFEVYESRAGVCQDFANLMICLMRLVNVPARYRVGYIYTGHDYDNTLQSDASHAWVEVYLPHLGWRGYDPTNGSRVGGDHVRVASGRNYRDATPTSGVLYRGGDGEELEIDVRVEDRTG